MPLTSSPSRILASAVLLMAVLVGLWAGMAGVTFAQVQIEQVQPAPDEVDGSSQAQVLVATDAGFEPQGVLNLIPDVASAPADASGNAATVFQDGDGNEAAIRQAGRRNGASATQIGNDNVIAITQDGAGSDAVTAAFDDGVPAPDAAFSAIQGTSPVGGGTGNLAVAVHEGSGNRTGIVQRGSNNLAGIRLVGSSNTMNLVQAGDKNQFLMDTTVDGMEKTVVQNGKGNTMDTTVPVNAEMNGNGMELVIRRDALGPLSPTP